MVVALLVSGCGGGEKKVMIHEAWARPGAAGGNSAIYFTVHNETQQDAALVSAAADVAETVEVHLSSMVDGVMKMAQQDSVPLPAGEMVNFAPGGLHVMLINLKKDLKPGDEFTAALRLADGTEISVPVVVQEP
jgi:copper(I)-binding protein